eukprot:scaffold803_cov310-Pinguiococcus_pyrenoidosus.AAC.107
MKDVIRPEAAVHEQPVIVRRRRRHHVPNPLPQAAHVTRHAPLLRTSGLRGLVEEVEEDVERTRRALGIAHDVDRRDAEAALIQRRGALKALRPLRLLARQVLHGKAVVMLPRNGIGSKIRTTLGETDLAQFKSIEAQRQNLPHVTQSQERKPRDALHVSTCFCLDSSFSVSSNFQVARQESLCRKSARKKDREREKILTEVVWAPPRRSCPDPCCRGSESASCRRRAHFPPPTRPRSA